LLQWLVSCSKSEAHRAFYKPTTTLQFALSNVTGTAALGKGLLLILLMVVLLVLVIRLLLELLLGVLMVVLLGLLMGFCCKFC